MSAKGFSLIEVMFSLGILSVGLLALATLVSTSQRGVASGRHSTNIAYLAQQKAEELYARRPVVPVKPNDIQSTDEVDGIRRKWSVTQQNNPRLWLITVEVFPPDSRDKPFSLKRLVFY